MAKAELTKDKAIKNTIRFLSVFISVSFLPVFTHYPPILGIEPSGFS
jgi:hypothetical protein